MESYHDTIVQNERQNPEESKLPYSKEVINHQTQSSHAYPDTSERIIEWKAEVDAQEIDDNKQKTQINGIQELCDILKDAFE